jgi:hypothetical protein
MVTSRFAAILLSFSLVGCATVEKQAFNKEVATNIKTIAVTERTGEETYDVSIIAHPGVSFGLVGGLIAAADMQAKSSKLTTALDPAQTQLQHLFAEKLAQSLGAAGYQTEIVPVAKTIDDKEVHNTVRAKLNADALLTVSVQGMYVAAGPTTDYFPYVVVRVLSTDVKTGAKLYQDTITYGYNFPGTKTVHLPGKQEGRFQNMDALIGDPKRTRDELYIGLEAIAAQIAADLKQ